MNVSGINTAAIEGRIDNNTNMQGGGANTPGSVIYIHPEDSSTGIVEIGFNTITNSGQDPAILALNHGDGAGPSTDTASLDVTIQNNTITVLGPNTFAIELSSGTDNNDKSIIYADVKNNTVTLGGSGNLAFGIANTGGANTFVYLQGFTTNGQTTWNNRGNTPLNSYAELINVNSPAAVPAAHNGGNVKTPSNAAAIAPDVQIGQADVSAASAEMKKDILLAVFGEARDEASVRKLTQEELNWMVQAAVERWRQAGISTDDLARMQQATFEISDLPEGQIATVNSTHMKIDETAADYGWYFDQTPMEDSEFVVPVPGKELQTTEYSPAYGKMDLLTVVMRELGTVYLQGKNHVSKSERKKLSR